jgi:hypothetical protein
MRVLAVLALAVSTLPAVAGTAAAETPTNGPNGATCGLASVLNVNAVDPDTQTGVIWAGPLLVTDPATGVASGTVRCTVQTGNNYTHAGFDAPGTRTSASGTGVATLEPTIVSYTAHPAQDVWLCTEFTYDGGPTFYWDGLSDTWSSSPLVYCSDATTPVGTSTDDVDDLVDGVVCPVLGVLPLAQTLKDLWGCERGAVPAGFYGYVVRPDFPTN